MSKPSHEKRGCRGNKGQCREGGAPDFRQQAEESRRVQKWILHARQLQQGAIDGTWSEARAHTERGKEKVATKVQAMTRGRNSRKLKHSAKQTNSRSILTILPGHAQREARKKIEVLLKREARLTGRVI